MTVMEALCFFEFQNGAQRLIVKITWMHSSAGRGIFELIEGSTLVVRPGCFGIMSWMTYTVFGLSINAYATLFWGETTLPSQQGVDTIV